VPFYQEVEKEGGASERNEGFVYVDHTCWAI